MFIESQQRTTAFIVHCYHNLVYFIFSHTIDLLPNRMFIYRQLLFFIHINVDGYYLGTDENVI